jgi:hypothetical protein
VSAAGSSGQKAVRTGGDLADDGERLSPGECRGFLYVTADNGRPRPRTEDRAVARALPREDGDARAG